MFLGEAKIPAGLIVYAIGDIHGRADLLADILAHIDRDSANARTRARRVIALGDYCDRGPDSRGVIDLLIARSADPDFVFLRGNHDQWVLDFLVDPFASGQAWIRYDGRETAASYGVDPDWDQDSFLLFKSFQRAFPKRHRQFLEQTRFSHEEGDFLFVHAGVKPGAPLGEQSPHDLMWIREEFHAHTGSFGKVVIHGHTPQDRVDVRPNRVNIDTRAFDSGVLSCLVLEENRYRVIDTKPSLGAARIG